MKFISLVWLGLLTFSFATALNITYPTTGARIDRSKDFNITWTLAENDPDANATINILASYTRRNKLTQRIASHVPVSDLKYNVSAYTLYTVGQAIFIFNTVGADGNRLDGESAVVTVLAGSGEQNATQTVGPTGEASSTTTTTTTGTTSTSTSSGVASGAKLGDSISFLTWLSVVGIGALF